MEDLPAVPFGKYKGKPITDLLGDKNYLEWCKNQPGLLERYHVIYNIVYNNQVSDMDAPTPEHNQLQNEFLNPNIRENLVKYLLDITFGGKKVHEKLSELYKDPRYDELFEERFERYPRISTSVEFEWENNWDVRISTTLNRTFFDRVRLKYKNDFSESELEKIESITSKEELGASDGLLSVPGSDKGFTDIKCKCGYSFRGYGKFKEAIEHLKTSGCFHIFRVLEDAKCFLNQGKIKYECERKAKELYFTLSHQTRLDEIICEIKPTLGDEYPSVLRKMKQQREMLYRKNKTHYGLTYCCSILVVGSFKSQVTTMDQLVEIFGQSRIRVVLFSDIRDFST